MDPRSNLDTLMARYQAGDAAAVTALVEAVGPQLHRFFMAQSVSRSDADDLLQETFCRFLGRKAGDGALSMNEAETRSYLFRIATNLALNSVRDNRHRQMDVSIDAPLEEDEKPVQLPARELRIDEHMIERDRSEFIRRTIQSLPEKQRVAVLLHKYEEMDYAEIAKILDCSESALKSLLFRAYETLRVQLAPLVGQSTRHPVAQRAGEGRP